MLKYVILLGALSIFITASDPFFGIDFSFKKTPKIKGDVTEHVWLQTDAFKKYLLDHDNRVSDLFPVTPYYFPNVQFWFLIYTQFDSSQVVIHDKSNLSLIYKVLDYSSLHEKALPRNTIYVLQQKTSSDKVKAIKDQLRKMADDPFGMDAEAKSMLRTISAAGITLPTKKLDRAATFNRLRDNIRTQIGQKNFIKEGTMRSLPYRAFLISYFESKKLPPELLAIPFLESSFNPKAESKVGAMGIWQFMPFIAKYFMPKRTKELDYRKNVGVASVSAAYLLSENYKILKSWDMAVTAYNSGTKHLLRTKRELNRPQVNLEDVIKHSDSQHFGFASKNFYSEFLALVHTLAYREEVYEDLHKNDRYNLDDPLHFFVSKCSLRLDKVLNEKQLDDVTYHNYQVSDLKKTYPRGLILSTKVDLPKSKFYKLSPQQIVKAKPIDWIKSLKNQSCSTR